MNDIDRLDQTMHALIAALDAHAALLKRSVEADEQMAALSASLMPSSGPVPIDVDALDWSAVEGSVWVGYGSERRPATDEEAAAVRARYPNATRGRGR